MSLRSLALAIATIAGLVAGLTGVVVYDREKSDRHDRARRGVAQTCASSRRSSAIPTSTTAPRGAIVEAATDPTTRRSRRRCARS